MKKPFFQRQIDTTFPEIDHSHESAYFPKMNSHLVTMGTVFIGNIQRKAIKAGKPFVLPTAEALRDYFEGLITAHLVVKPLGYGKTLEDDAYVSRLLDGPKGAVAYSLETFDPSVILKRIEYGKKSKRGPSYQPEILIGINHLSKAEIARLRGISTSTVARLRRQLPEVLLNIERTQKAMDAAIAKLRRALKVKKRNRARVLGAKKRARALEARKRNEARASNIWEQKRARADEVRKHEQEANREHWDDRHAAMDALLDGAPSLSWEQRELVLS